MLTRRSFFATPVAASLISTQGTTDPDLIEDSITIQTVDENPFFDYWGDVAEALNIVLGKAAYEKYGDRRIAQVTRVDVYDSNGKVWELTDLHRDHDIETGIFIAELWIKMYKYHHKNEPQFVGTGLAPWDDEEGWKAALEAHRAACGYPVRMRFTYLVEKEVNRIEIEPLPLEFPTPSLEFPKLSTDFLEWPQGSTGELVGWPDDHRCDPSIFFTVVP